MTSQVRRHGSRRSRLRRGILVLAVAVGGFYFSLTHSLPFVSAGGRLFRAEFTEASQVNGPTPLGSGGQTPVRVNGVDVGHVESITLTDGGRAGIVSMRITDDSLRLHSDASAAAKFRTLLGAQFVIVLNPGSDSAPPLRGNFIGLSHTSVQSEFDDVLRVFGGNTPRALRIDLRQLATGLGGGRARTLVDSLAPTLAPTPAAFAALRGRASDDLSGLVRSAAHTTQAIGRYESSLQQLISGGQQTLRATADESGPLAAALQRAPASLDSTVAVSRAIESTLPPLDALIRDLRPGARDLAPAAIAARPAVNELAIVLNHARPLLRSLRPAVSQLAAAAPFGQALVDALAPTVTRLDDQLIPYLKKPDSDLKRPLYQLIAPTFDTLASATSEYDGQAHLIHFPIQPTTGSITILPCSLFAGAPSPSQLLQCASLNSVLLKLLGGS